ncbi:CHASE2 domain-containing protein [Variovorax sp. PAMC28562]|uniref:CHASE2 domain-containing protein n=1 Tax=Variovorax sp. PAMC28562 TaxID=2762323 RepID=UPI00164EAF52|nr:CHASE2 domain-containing protein [Variovorax sp. PAMC28562]QNK74417.1 CHASE2 domain-containing protein [Variovorax sp. PAMC28562]
MATTPAPLLPGDSDPAPQTPFRKALQRYWRRRGAWLVLTVGLLALVTELTLTQPLPRFDRLLQENTGAPLEQKPSGNVVIVAIDEKSLAAIGRWPWRRALHAEALRRIAAQNPRCIGFDLLLPEQDSTYAADDAVLAQAMQDSGCVVLPMALQSVGQQTQKELLPTPLLARAANAIGHAHLSLDQDGITRSVYMREGFEGRPWPHFVVALHDAALAYEKGQAPPPRPPLPAIESNSPWLREQHELVVFARGEQPFGTVSYVDVLQGRVAPDVFRDKYVLVGATAVGMGDAYATTAPSVTGLTPGVQIFADVLEGVLSGRRVVDASIWQDLAYNLLPLAVALFGLLWLRPVGVIALIGAMLALRLGLNATRPWVGVQFAPAAGFAGLLLVYPLWSFLRLYAALSYLRWETAQLALDFKGGTVPLPPPRPGRGDFLDRQMAATSAAAQRMRDLHRFVRDGIDHLPDATMILNGRGRVMISNIAAQRYWQTDATGLFGRDAHRLLAELRWRTTGAPMMPTGALLNGVQPIMGEGEDPKGHSLLLRCVPFFDDANAHAGWMVALVDISKMRRAQGQRDEALRFISHDIREPSASILTTIELARTRPELFEGDALFQRIERHARTGLELADGFVNLARAEAQPFRAEILDLVALMQMAIDDAWIAARQRKVRVLLTTALEDAPCTADRSLLTRALINVLSNALKYSPPGADLRCSLVEAEADSGPTWRIGVQDQGPGIPPELQSQLFQPFNRLHRDSHPDVHGVGLGLLLVRTAVHRHGGTIEIDSAANAGCTVTLVLPRPTAAELEELRKDVQE